MVWHVDEFEECLSPTSAARATIETGIQPNRYPPVQRLINNETSIVHYYEISTHKPPCVSLEYQQVLVYDAATKTVGTDIDSDAI
uniref:Uncharacterized protein n=1 Tax=Vespula pensylvanica TaxID=30213 RepID=A0A834P9W0_VESPE|nr:hypothetical protein H0235_002595 [Vespula pensylvanica]